MNDFDVVVVGGGMIGAATALGLARLGKQVAIIEHKAPSLFSPADPIDLRISAISYASVQFLHAVGVWDAIVEMRACPYQRLATWEDPRRKLAFDAASLGLSELGFMVENRVVQLALWQALADLPNVQFFCGSHVDTFSALADGHQVTLADGKLVSGRWLVGADGAHSKVRSYAKIGISQWDYRQHCLLINVKTELGQQNITWQQFTPHGPRAFLPFIEHHASLVWYDNPLRINALENLNAAQLRAEILANFPAELGEIEVQQWGSFPLTRRHAHCYYQPNLVLVGDAAHTIHPLAGQGVNLGFKDVAALLSLVQTAGDNWQQTSVLRAYQRERKTDNLLMQTGMDLFYKGFGNDILPLKGLRNIGLLLAENSGGLKTKVLKYALGIK